MEAVLLTRGLWDGCLARARENTLAGTHSQTLVPGLILMTLLLDEPRAPSWETSISDSRCSLPRAPLPTMLNVCPFFW